MLLEFFDAILAFFAVINYWGVFFLMTIESSFIPFPSEIIVPPAAYLAAQGQLNLYFVILAASFGSLLGALINYFLARFLGRPIIYRLLKTRLAGWLLLSEEKVKRAEDFFVRYNKSSTFFGRLIPVVRQLISLPAGFAKMNIFSFSVFTFLGALIWSSILAFLGYFFGAHDEKLRRYYHEIVYILLFLAILVIAYLVLRNYRKKKRQKKIILDNQ
jgi:membrane protein DedA with SNARE-associated domain